MPVYNIPRSPIPTSSTSDSVSVGVKTPEEKTLDDIVGNVRTFEYSVTGFCAGLSKIVRTKTKERYFFTPYKKSADEFKYDERLSQSISRTRRVILELEGEEGFKHIEEYSDGTTERGKNLRKSICEQLHFASLEFQSLKGIVDAIGIGEENLCTYCWNGKE